MIATLRYLVRIVIVASLALGVLAGLSRPAAAESAWYYTYWGPDGCQYGWDAGTQGFVLTGSCVSLDYILIENGCSYAWDGYAWQQQVCAGVDERGTAFLQVHFTDGVTFRFMFYSAVPRWFQGRVFPYTLSDGTTGETFSIWSWDRGEWVPLNQAGWDGRDRNPSIVTAPGGLTLGDVMTDPLCAMLLPSNFDGDDGDAYAGLSDIAEECS